MTNYDHIMLGTCIFNILYWMFLKEYLELPEEKEYWARRKK
jgi:hypothetical protein